MSRRKVKSRRAPRGNGHNSLAAARAAGLRYVSDAAPGIRRIRRGRGFSYADADGRTVRDPETLHRIRSLVIPPAWEDVWICPSPKGHIQVTARDARGRKQYRYHPLWNELRNLDKFTRMAAFGRALPGIRRRVAADLREPKLARRKVLATVVKLLEQTAVRVGNDEYARQNGSYGLTTLRRRHVKWTSNGAHFVFRGKSGRNIDVAIDDARLCHVIRSCAELPGHELFKYRDADGAVHEINSEDVNDYLRDVSGGDFTAKDFRTWVGTHRALLELERIGAAGNQRAAKRNVAEAIKCVAAHLRNRPATCRKYYVHPALLECYAQGNLLTCLAKRVRRRSHERGLRLKEVALLRLLDEAARSNGS